jgi:hypothetical protein
LQDANSCFLHRANDGLRTRSKAYKRMYTTPLAEARMLKSFEFSAYLRCNEFDRKFSLWDIGEWVVQSPQQWGDVPLICWLNAKVSYARFLIRFSNSYLDGRKALSVLRCDSKRIRKIICISDPVSNSELRGTK